ncbi:MAG: DUF885 domain-containing protein [Candidatus Eremiobacteraeota bacterium]|nr:DUF885 domain-containing protein [Candidatus Eremiobacteraeota bacterium]
MRLALLAVVAAMLLAAVPVSAQTADSALAATAQRYFAEQWKDEPLQATRLGIHDYDDQIGDFSAAGYARRVERAKRYLAELDGIDARGLSADGRADLGIFRAALQFAALGEVDAMQRWRHDPSTYTRAAANAVFGLLHRDFAPLPDRLRSIIARERALPTMLRLGGDQITSVDATTAEISKGDIAGTIAFFERVLPPAVASVDDAALRRDFSSSNEAVIASLREFATRMAAAPFARPSGTYAIGADLFAKRLALQEATPISLADYERVGEQSLARTRAEFVATAKKIDPARSPEAVADDLGRDHPTADELLPRAAQDLDQLRAFVAQHHLITLPPDWDVKVIPTPEFERQTSFASMDAPGPFEKVATQAYYRITPVEPTWSKQRQEEHLAFFNNPYRPIISAHEVMPGHYLNFVIVKHESESLIRMVLRSPSFTEGWAHYDEQMIVDEGWGNGDPRVRLAQLQGALLRECRYLVGLRLHTQGMTIADATRFFMTNAFMGQEPAHREALRGTQDPLYGYYTLGKLEILKLRADYQKKMGREYSLQRFHDALLAHGYPPVAIVRKLILGPNDDGSLL